MAALLAGTGPVQLGRDTVSSETAVNYLSRAVYQRYPDYQDVDRATQALVTETFGRIAGGQLDLKNLVKGVADQAGQRRVLVWAADPNEELTLQGSVRRRGPPEQPRPVRHGRGQQRRRQQDGRATSRSTPTTSRASARQAAGSAR